MNAKKIMGAVLVALLAAALFVGAGSAAVTETDFGTVFIGQDESTAEDGTYINGAYKVTISGGVVSGDNVEGTYTSAAKNTIYVSKPTAKYDAVGTITNGNVKYIVANGGNVYLNSLIEFGAEAAAAGVELDGFLVTLPSGKVTTVGAIDYTTGANPYTATGTYSIQAIFNKTDFIDGFNSAALVDANAFTFTIVDESDATISASVSTVYSGDYVTFTIEGTIGTTYKLALDGFVKDGTPVVTLDGPVNDEGKAVYTFVMPNSGVANFQFKVQTTDKEASVELRDADNDEIETVEVTVSKPVLTAKVGASSYFVGDEIEISGTSTSGAKLVFTIEGTNFKETLLEMNEEEFGKTWEADLETEGVTELDAENGKKLDVGTYTINIYELDPAVVNTQEKFEDETDGEEGAKAVKTVVVALKQPFVTIIEAPEVIVQNTEADFVIGAEATDAIRYYIFGTNYFNASNEVSGPDKDTTNQFSFTLKKEFTDAMDAGQYFMVIQHPMYDGDFNILAFSNAFYLNTSGEAVADEGFLFNVNDRQTANAAQALCDALDTQNIDDMYVKYSFFVVGEDESFTISDIPSQIAKGTTLVISGVDTANAEKTVVVEMMSTAFAAVPKETVGSAAFIAVTTEVAEDGTWEVTLDTSDLNVDEYSLSVVINDATKKNVKVNVVEAADKPDTPDTPDVPDTPDTPDTPTEPETPGFGALAALAGLGAVAVLLLRRE